MLIPRAALAVVLAMGGASVTAQSQTGRPAIADFSGPDLARAIKTDFESITGTGTVNVSSDSLSHFSVRIAMPGFDAKVCAQVYQRESALHQLFPSLSFDFYFDGPELAGAIKADLEAITGRDTVDVSIDSKTLFNVRIAIQDFSSRIYSQVYDRELEFYRAFPDLNFDFYLRPMERSGR